MKMHLQNILNQLGATENEKQQLIQHFEKRPVTHIAVVEEFDKIRVL
jgi:hydroxymethylglutaryl-CoA reductase